MVTWLDMLKGRTRKQVPAAQVLPYVGFAVLFFLFIWRAFRGFDWSDESAAFAAPYRLLLGDLPLVDSWDSHPGWLVLAAPFLKLYQNWQGNMDGVLLAGRLCFAAVQIFVSVIVYHRLFLFCKSHLASMLAGWLTASFVPGMVLNFSAQSVSLLAMVLSCTGLLVQYRQENGLCSPCTLLSGLFSGLAVCIYPTFFPALLPMALMLVLFRPGKCKKGIRSLLPLFCFIAGAVVLPLLLVLYLQKLIGWTALTENFQWLITSRSSPFSQYGHAFFTFFQGYSKADFLSLAELSLLFMLLLAKWAPIPVDLPFSLETIFQLAIKIALPLCFLANVVYVIVQPDWNMPSSTKMGYLLTSAGIWPVILCIQNPSRRSRLLLLGLYLPGMLMALGAHLSDQSSDFGASFALLPSMLAAVLLVYENYGPLLRSVNRGTMETAVAILRTCMAMVAFFLLGTTLFIRCGLAYGDLPVSQLTTLMTSGPAQGIYTNDVDAAAYETMVQEIKETQSDSSRVLILGNLPFGYLCTENRPSAPMVENVNLNSRSLYDYLAEDLRRRPDWIYVPKGIYGMGNEDNQSSVWEVQLIASGTVKSRETACSRIYVTLDDKADDEAIKTIVNNEMI